MDCDSSHMTDIIDVPSDASSECEDEHASFQLRPYQLEMVEESIKGNIIVAMDTGSGKTPMSVCQRMPGVCSGRFYSDESYEHRIADLSLVRSAITRAQMELERCDPRKLVWFLAPTVTLCHQQFQLTKASLPAYQSRLLCGNDEGGRWSDKRVWDGLLNNIRIVFSTHAVLFEALTHGFVTMSRFALLVFDEAHHCTGNHSANQIMANFYAPLVKSGSIDLPSVLGLSASPVINAQAGGLDAIEHNLYSVVKTPKIHRSNLENHVFRPVLEKVCYQKSGHDGLSDVDTAALRTLRSVYLGLDILEDPYVVELQRQMVSDELARQRFRNTLFNHKTYCQEQMRQLTAKAAVVFEELGGWAADWFIESCISKFNLTTQHKYNADGWSDKELSYLDSKFEIVRMSLAAHRTEPTAKSPKVRALIDILHRQNSPGFKGLVFVEQRATVATLAHLLASNGDAVSHLQVGTFFGTSTSSMRKGKLTDIVETRNQQKTLENFRQGDLNLIITTNVLEEGIDIPSCNVVICFDPPHNLKSFIQRRGRARKQESKYIIMLASDDIRSMESTQWQDLEEKMKAAYQDDSRVQPPAEPKSQDTLHRTLRIESTGALLTTDTAMSHLIHFCSTFHEHYVDCRPQIEYSFNEDDEVSAEIFLTNAVEPGVRRAVSSRYWPTQKMAKKDAAFEAYRALYNAGLVNDNLLPLTKDMEGVPEMINDSQGPSMVYVSSKVDPWLSMARAHTLSPILWSRTMITLQSRVATVIRMVMMLPSGIPPLPKFSLGWNNVSVFHIHTQVLEPAQLSDSEIKVAQTATRLILRSVHGTRMKESRLDFPALFVPCDILGGLQDWCTSMEGVTPAINVLSQRLTKKPTSLNLGLVREQGKAGSLYLFQDLCVLARPSWNEGMGRHYDDVTISVTKFPKPRNFLHPPVKLAQNEVDSYTTVYSLPADGHTLDNLPSCYAIFALFVPSILHRCEGVMLANELSQGPVSPVAFTNLDLVLSAVTASSTNEDANYQRLEFLGDCVLKFITSVQLMAQHPTWPERYLTAEKGRTNSNMNLAKASVRAGLDRFLVTKAFTGVKWRPRYVGDILMSEPKADEKILCSSKVLADVVESLFGAAFAEGDLQKARICIQSLLPDERWDTLEDSLSSLFDRTPMYPVQLQSLEKLVGYELRKKTFLLEAITHASFNIQTTFNVLSYQRLEFLGDAVLDFIVVKELYSFKPDRPHQLMHAIRAAVVNASFLAFLCMDLSIAEERLEIVSNSGDGMRGNREETGWVNRSLWQFMRNSSQAIQNAQQSALERFHSIGPSIRAALNTGSQYPWSLLTALQADKFFSDLVESVIGAIFIDNLGDLGACGNFLEKLGLLRHMRRLLRDKVDCLHPKERLGQAADQEKVTYSHDREGSLWRCQVRIGERDVGERMEGQSRIDAETRAASKACSILLQGKGLP